MVNNLSALTRCCAGPLPVAQVSLCVSVNVLRGEGPLPVPTSDFWGLKFEANLERKGRESRTLCKIYEPINFGCMELHIGLVSVKTSLCNNHFTQIQIIHVTQCE